jgi:uncharacterized protein (DUF1015 family)
MAAPVPTLGPFRALRYDPAVVGDLSAVISPPYDVISPAQRARLLARHPRNVVRIELPTGAAGEGGPDPADPYRAAADTLHAWRQDGTLQVDQQPSLYVYEQRYHLPGDPSEGAARMQRGYFARLRLEPFGEGVRPHERTLSAPKEDRLRLLRATETNTSPIVVLSDDREGRTAEILAGVAAEPPMAEATDDAGTRHRIWALATEGAARELIAGAQRRPLTIADGHHRYETALRYRDERRSEGSASAGGTAADGGDHAAGEHPFDDDAFEYVLALILDAGGAAPEGGPVVLPTHRLLAGDAGLTEGLIAGAGGYFTVSPRAPNELVREFAPPFAAGAPGSFGLLVRGAAYDLAARPEAVEPLFAANVPAVVRELDSAILEAVLGRLVADPQLSYTHDAQEARRALGSGDAAAAFLLRPTAVADVVRVAAAGALMPQKSTYFYPKAATGLVMYPLG